MQLVPDDAAEHTLEVPGAQGPRTIPVGRYGRGSLGRQTCAGAGMVSGPTLLRSGLMSTELLLRHGAARLRVAVQHAPAEGKAEGAGPALLCYRCVVARERCAAALGTAPGAPTREAAKRRRRSSAGVERRPPQVEAQRWQGTDAPADGDDTHFWTRGDLDPLWDELLPS